MFMDFIKSLGYDIYTVFEKKRGLSPIFLVCRLFPGKRVVLRLCLFHF